MRLTHIPVIAWLRTTSWPRGIPAAAPPCRGPRAHSHPSTPAVKAGLRTVVCIIAVVSGVFLAFAPAALAHTRYYAGWGRYQWCYPRNTLWRCQQRYVTATVFAPPGPSQSTDQPEGVISLTAWVRLGNGSSIGVYPYRLATTDPWQTPQCQTYAPTGNPTAENALQSGLFASTFDCRASSAGHFWHWATLSGTRHYVLEDWYQIQLTRTDTTPYGQSSSIGWTGTYCLRIASEATGNRWYGVYETGCYDPLVSNA
jgi:hypothetical protein